VSFLKRLFTAPDLDQQLGAAEALAARGALGDAKLAFEKALARAKKERPDAVATLEQRIVQCCDSIAAARLEEARRLLQAGHLDLAAEELEHALQTAVSSAPRAAIQAELDALQRSEVRREMQTVEAPADARFELLTGGWEDDQYEEYIAHGEPLRDALLALDSGDAASAREILEALLPDAAEPRYLWFELGRARLIVGETEPAREALATFLGRVGPDEGGDARLVAHMELAAIHTERAELEAAIGQYQAALEAFADDPRPYLAMGSFFRRRELWEEAVEVLEAGLSVLDEGRPDFRFWHELGLAHAGQGHDAQAIELLERMVSFLTSHQQLDLPPEGTRRLAELQERAGKPERASDLFALLAAGSDRPNLGLYHLEAGRLMHGLGLERDARRMLQRASELVDVDSEQAARARALLAELG
jgi:tetratricopeptide (TPR) repeat protein